MQTMMSSSQFRRCGWSLGAVKKQSCRAGSHLREGLTAAVIVNGENWVGSDCKWDCGVHNRKKTAKENDNRGARHQSSGRVTKEPRWF